jgi:DNA-binding transcriptional MerR regulator
MTNEADKIEMLYSPGEAIATLKIKESTLRKYAELFEKYGHSFNKNTQGHRGYTDSDVMLLKRVIETKNKPGMTLEAAVKSVVSVTKNESVAVTDTKDIALHEQHSKDIAELKETVSKQTEVIRELMKRLEERDRQKDERDKLLMEGIRQLQEQKQELLQLAAAKEEEAENKKGFWSRFFNRN